MACEIAPVARKDLFPAPDFHDAVLQDKSGPATLSHRLSAMNVSASVPGAAGYDFPYPGVFLPPPHQGSSRFSAFRPQVS